MRFYLQRNDGTYSDHADYGESAPEEREDGEWVAGDPPAEGDVWDNKLPLTTLLAQVEQLAAESRAILAPTEAALVYLLNKSDTDAATLLVEGLPDEGLEAFKLAMLAVLQ